MMRRPLTGLILAALLMAGCSTTAESPKDQLPFMLPGDLRPSKDEHALADLMKQSATPLPPPPNLSPEDRDYIDAPKAAMPMAILSLPLHVSTDPAWALAPAPAFPPEVAAYLKANGLRIGLIPADKLSDFATALANGDPSPQAFVDPNRRGVRHQQALTVTVSRFPQPILLGPKLPDTSIPVLTAPGRKLPEDWPIQAGQRAQLLLSASVSGGHAADMTLIPQIHHVALHAFERSNNRVMLSRPWQREIEGKNLAPITLPPPPVGQYYLVGLDWPWELLTPDTQGPVPIDDPKHKVVKHYRPVPLPDHLGTALFTQSDQGQPTQIMLLIGQ